MALPTGGYSFTPQIANLGVSPLASLKPLDVGVSIQFTPMPKYEVPSAQQELVSIGAAKGLQALADPIIAAFVKKEELREKKIKERLDRGLAKEIAEIRAKGSKTDEEKKYEEEYKDARLKVLKKQLGKEDKDEPIDDGTLDDPDAAAEEDLDNLAPSGQEMWELPSTDLEAEPVDFSLSEFPLSNIQPTPQEVQNLWSKPLSELTAATPAGAGQAAQLAAMQAGQIPVPSQDMSTDVQAKVRPLTPAYDLTAKYKGLVSPEQAQGMREQFYKATGEQMTGLGQPSLANMPPPSAPVAQARKEAAPQAATLGSYLKTWADPDVAAKAQQKIAEIMGSNYAPAEIEEITNKTGERGFKVKYPKKLTAKEIQDIKKSEGTGIDFDTEKKLRDEFVTQSKDYKTIQSAWRSIRTSGSEASAAGDMSLIFGFMKLLDPSSTVREGEYANAQNAAGVPDRVAAAYNKAINGQILADAQRKDFLNQAKKQYDSRLGEHNQIKKEFTRLAKEYNVEPKRVVLEFSMPEEVSSTENLAQQVQSKIKELQSYPANSEQRLKAASELNALRQQLTGSK